MSNKRKYLREQRCGSSRDVIGFNRVLNRYTSGVSGGLIASRVHRSARKAWCGLRVLLLFNILFLQLSVLATGSVTLAWNASPDPIVAGYRIYYGGASHVYTNEIDVGGTTNGTITGLVAGAIYYFAARSYTTTGVESLFSAELPYSVPVWVLLSPQIVKSNGLPVALSVFSAGTVSGSWALQLSTDLKSWTTIERGTNIPINLVVPVLDRPKEFFRLSGQ